MNVVQTEKRSLSALCTLLGYCRQAYYKSIKATEQEHYQAELIIQRVIHIRVEQPKLGVRKLYHLLQDFLLENSFSIGRDSLFDLLREYRLLIRRRKRAPITTYSRHWLHKYPNLIERLIPDGSCQVWVSDITYIRVNSGFAYLSLITDAYSRMIVGFHLSRDLSANSCLRALDMALLHHPNRDGLIHHSDRGIQYCSQEYVNLLNNMQIKISMTKKGDPLENAIAERLNGILKMELLSEKYSRFETALEGIREAVAIYNNKRPHSSIDMLTPSIAHYRKGTIKRRWKSYYRIQMGKEVTMT
jgi:putative transposase